jgi:hypothetical protein
VWPVGILLPIAGGHLQRRPVYVDRYFVVLLPISSPAASAAAVLQRARSTTLVDTLALVVIGTRQAPGYRAHGEIRQDDWRLVSILHAHEQLHGPSSLRTGNHLTSVYFAPGMMTETPSDLAAEKPAAGAGSPIRRRIALTQW